MARIAAVLFALALTACGLDQPQFNNTDITGAEYGKALSLADPSGKIRTLADFKGSVVVVFFGFTQCPDVCPTTLAEMKTVKKLLGEDAKRFQVLFVTVDPERDTPELLAQYVTAFDPTFLGLRGDPETTAKVAKDFKVFYQKVPGNTPDSYSVDHTAGSYIFDPQGHLRLFVRHGQSADKIAADIKQLLAQG
ncbi:MAG: SCO family protein [Betaproteobacteria bacterium]|jgi:protein SCO1/2|nr:SCO family protein [Betaproteobacteria bacterium]